MIFFIRNATETEIVNKFISLIPACLVENWLGMPCILGLELPCFLISNPIQETMSRESTMELNTTEDEQLRGKAKRILPFTSLPPLPSCPSVFYLTLLVWSLSLSLVPRNKEKANITSTSSPPCPSRIQRRVSFSRLYNWTWPDSRREETGGREERRGEDRRAAEIREVIRQQNQTPFTTTTIAHFHQHPKVHQPTFSSFFLLSLSSLPLSHRSSSLNFISHFNQKSVHFTSSPAKTKRKDWNAFLLD